MQFEVILHQKLATKRSLKLLRPESPFTLPAPPPYLASYLMLPPPNLKPYIFFSYTVKTEDRRIDVYKRSIKDR